MTTALGDRLADNVRQLRAARGKTQLQMAEIADLPRRLREAGLAAFSNRRRNHIAHVVVHMAEG